MTSNLCYGLSKLKAVILQAGLALIVPHARLLKSHDFRFNRRVKASDQEFQPRWTDREGSSRRFRTVNAEPLNGMRVGLGINLQEQTEIGPNGRSKGLFRIVGLPLAPDSKVATTRGWILLGEPE